MKVKYTKKIWFLWILCLFRSCSILQPGTSTAVLQLKNLQKAPVGAVHEDSQRGEPPRKQPALESVTIRKANKEIPTLKAAIPAQKKILTG